MHISVKIQRATLDFHEQSIALTAIAYCLARAASELSEKKTPGEPMITGGADIGLSYLA